MHTPDESVADVITELRAFVNDSLATEAFAAGGIKHQLAFIDQLPTKPENPDPTIFIGVGEPNERFAPHSQWRLSEVRQQLADGGPVEQRLGRQWIVYVYTAWDNEYRPRLERARGLEKDALKVPLMGDFRRLRNDVVHHRGIATKKNAGKCKIIGHWVTLGSPIHVTPERFDEFWRLFPWAELEATPTSGA